jgi:tRNA threonylcarbamoyladenosine modification (KEOPS) complex Cgi121 subunit
MAPLFLNEVIVGSTAHQIGVFGCTPLQSRTPQSLVELAQRVATAHEVTIQVVDAKYVVGPNHLLFAAIHALTAFHRGTQRATTLAMEILRYIAAQRQIAQALKIIGITKSTQHLAGILLNQTSSRLQTVYKELLIKTNGTDNPRVLLITSKEKEQEIKDVFEVTNQELKAISQSNRATDRRSALEKLVYDRCALLAISR